MARTVGRGVENKRETLESVKQELERVNNVGLELIKANEDLNAKLVKAEEKLKKLKETDK